MVDLLRDTDRALLFSHAFNEAKLDLLRDKDGVVRASLDTDNAAVRAWAESMHERYWSDARPLDADDV